MKNMHLHIPDYMWKAINEMELPGNTVTSKLLILLEKGINYYAKVNKKAAKRANQGDQEQKQDTTPRVTWEEAYQLTIAQRPMMIDDFWRKIEPDPHDYQFPWEYLEKWQEWKKDAIANCK